MKQKRIKLALCQEHVISLLVFQPKTGLEVKKYRGAKKAYAGYEQGKNYSPVTGQYFSIHG